MASAAGEADREQDPAWMMALFRMSSSFTASSSRNISAPGFRAKVKLRFPSGARLTKAKVVMAWAHSLGLSTRTPFSSIVRTRKRPKSSSPTLLHIPASSPQRAAVMAALPGAPPGFRI